MHAEGWPVPIAQYLDVELGAPLAIERLGGKSAAAVYRVQGGRGAAIVKARANPREVRFYERVAPVLSAVGIATPRLELAARERGAQWLILEEIPTALPRERWTADPDVLATLGRLHASPRPAPRDLPDRFRPAWTETMNAAALAGFAPEVAARLAPVLEALRRESQRLFRPRCWIAGDPNPTNWGLRADGRVVLFDWERFGRGTPALDLAITVPGLGTADQFRLFADRYVALVSTDVPRSWSSGDLARDLALAKAWSLVEFLCGAAGARSERQRAAARTVAAQIPAWLGAIAAAPR